MINNYISTTVNYLFKNKIFSLINIAGLSIGLAAFLLISLYVFEETSYDAQWQNSDSIYRLNFTYSILGREPVVLAASPVAAMPVVEQYFPEEIEYSARLFGNQRTLQVGSKRFEEYFVSVDPEIVSIFQFELLQGNFQDTFSAVTNIALSESVAIRLFGADDPIGKVVSVNNAEGVAVDYQVAAIYRIPGNTVLNIPMFALLDDSLLPQIYGTWLSTNVHAYFKLKSGVDVAALEPYLPDIINQHVDITPLFPDAEIKASEIASMSMQNIESVHLDSPFDTTRAGGNKLAVQIFAVISMFVLFIGCINFTVLSTARSAQRVNEVAMRKVVGAKRVQLITQFLGECYFIVFSAMLLSVGLVELTLPLFESMVGKSLAVDYSAPANYLFLFSLLVIVGAGGGLLPALVMSGIRPVVLLKANRLADTRGSVSLRNFLVVFQFTISIMLIIATTVIYAQLIYSNNRDPGYNKENLLVIDLSDIPSELRGQVAPLKQELVSLASISDVAFSSVQPSQLETNLNSYSLVGEGTEARFSIARTSVGFDYFTTYQIPLVAGRFFINELDRLEPGFDFTTGQLGNAGQPLREASIVINVRAARELGFSDPQEAIGKVINSTVFGNVNYAIIGVVADNHIFSINAPPRAETYLLDLNDANFITVRFQGSVQRIVEQVNSVWESVMGDTDLSSVIADQLVADEFRQEQTEVKILITFSILAIFIACLGLFGLAVFTVEQRIKEIGIRKVVGAEIKEIVVLLLWQFSKPVLLANIFAWPLAFWTMLNWLQRFPYRIDSLLIMPLCILAGVVAMSIAWVTVGGTAAKAASQKPVLALRYE